MKRLQSLIQLCKYILRDLPLIQKLEETKRGETTFLSLQQISLKPLPYFKENPEKTLCKNKNSCKTCPREFFQCRLWKIPPSGALLSRFGHDNAFATAHPTNCQWGREDLVHISAIFQTRPSNSANLLIIFLFAWSAEEKKREVFSFDKVSLSIGGGD